MRCLKTAIWVKIKRAYEGGHKMKKIVTLPLLLLFSIVLVACGNTSEDLVETPATDVTDSTDDTTNVDNAAEDNSKDNTSNAAGQDDMLKQMEAIDYKDFDLQVEYANDQEYEVELEQNSDNSVKAKIEDELNNTKKYDEDAFNDLYPLVKQLSITQETSKEEAIKETLSVFNLPEDYQKFELEIKFKDGTKIEFEDKK